MISRLKRWWRRWRRGTFDAPVTYEDLGPVVELGPGDYFKASDVLRDTDTGDPISVRTVQSDSWISSLFQDFETPESARLYVAMLDFNREMAGVVAELEEMNR